MSNNKVRIFSIFLLFGIAAILFPFTALPNSIAMGQEYNPEYEENAYEKIEYYNQEYNPEYEENAYENENEYYNQEYNPEYEENAYENENENYNQEYNPYKNKNKDAPIVNVEKKLFICSNVTESPNDFACEGPSTDFGFFYPAAPDSGEYIPCNDEICPFLDESDFNAQIFKDVATVRNLSPEGTPVNLDKFHYTVTERSIEETIETGDQCKAVGFTHDGFYEKVVDNTVRFYFICVDYVGDCEGTIYPGEVKTCTIENYIVERFIEPLETSSNTAGSTQSFSHLASILPDRIRGLAE